VKSMNEISLLKAEKVLETIATSDLLL